MELFALLMVGVCIWLMGRISVCVGRIKQLESDLEISRTTSRNLKDIARKQTDLNTQLTRRCKQLAKYEPIVQVELAIKQMITKARAHAAAVAEEGLRQRAEAVKEAENMRAEIAAEAKQQREALRATRQRAEATNEKKQLEAQQRLLEAGEQAANIIAAAQTRAEAIAGEAYSIKGRADQFADTAAAMERVIHGYGDEYLKPTFSFLDELSEAYGHTDAGAQLSRARSLTRACIQAGRAASCEYVENYRRKIAENFVIDAFNGKVDSILARGKTDNVGKLEQEIRDAFALVNHNGRAFRNAGITPEYLEARVEELKWAAAVRIIKEQEREEQRQLREQMREEERARREYERVIKEAAKEEDNVRRSMLKVQQQIAKAKDEQRAEFEGRLAELQARLVEAESKNLRALSMAQQTKTGHVYVISNIGSFGENVFKIGMTRRLEPRDRVRELGDASVPFAFDIHALIFSEDAPKLERLLHQHFLQQQLNKVNPRKEFFRTSLSDIRCAVEGLGLSVHWTMLAEALDYRESLKIEQQIQSNQTLAQEWAAQQQDWEDALEEDEALA